MWALLVLVVLSCHTCHVCGKIAVFCAISSLAITLTRSLPGTDKASEGKEVVEKYFCCCC